MLTNTNGQITRENALFVSKLLLIAGWFCLPFLWILHFSLYFPHFRKNTFQQQDANLQSQLNKHIYLSILFILIFCIIFSLYYFVILSQFPILFIENGIIFKILKQYI